jgi:hypothetical protein
MKIRNLYNCDKFVTCDLNKNAITALMPQTGHPIQYAGHIRYFVYIVHCKSKPLHNDS